ncbi:hypothetical protein [Candidatus Venteria ishoeyi]|uniref:hypothetical protein n=1 Tax=Candidatus Venteria ishoeyi TaxID=1899563 RepID=UPI0015B26454|nr:hypothetical protein [Candidatus Venteria ishoeyi]
MLKNLFKSLLRITLGVVIGIPLLLYPLLYFFQEKILFFPQPIHPEIAQWATLHYPHAAQRLDIAKWTIFTRLVCQSKTSAASAFIALFWG